MEPFEMVNSEKKYLCDHMCADLGKWLRIAGYDAIIIDSGLSDEEVLNLAVKERRCILTKDSDFKKKKEAVLLKGKSLEAWVKQLKEEEGINWLYRPFSRCLKCNVPLETVALDRWVCPSCHQEFWLGSHTEHMAAQLRAWSENHFYID